MSDVYANGTSDPSVPSSVCPECTRLAADLAACREQSDRDVIERNRVIAEKSAENERLRELLREIRDTKFANSWPTDMFDRIDAALKEQP